MRRIRVCVERSDDRSRELIAEKYAKLPRDWDTLPESDQREHLDYIADVHLTDHWDTPDAVAHAEVVEVPDDFPTRIARIVGTPKFLIAVILASIIIHESDRLIFVNGDYTAHVCVTRDFSDDNFNSHTDLHCRPSHGFRCPSCDNMIPSEAVTIRFHPSDVALMKIVAGDFVRVRSRRIGWLSGRDYIDLNKQDYMITNVYDRDGIRKYPKF